MGHLRPRYRIQITRPYCPTEIKEIAEIIVTRPREVLSDLSAGHYYLMRIVFFCPTEIKEIAEIIVTGPAKFFLLFLRDNLSRADSNYCPAVIGFAASLVEEIKEIKEIFTPSAKHFLLFLLFLRDFIIPCDWLFHERVFLSHGKNGKNGNLYSVLRSLSVISVISVGLLLYHADSILLSHRNKGNSRNYSYRSRRSNSCYICVNYGCVE